jgi:heme exporter protein A
MVAAAGRGTASPRQAVRARAVSYASGGRLLVRAISLTVERGEVVAVTGANGAGKTTLLRLLSTRLRPSAGSVTWFGDSGADAALARARIGFMGHETFLYGHLTARENLLYYAALQRVPARARRARVDALLGEVGLGGVADQPVRSFSRGMGQRLALARAFVATPDLLLLDEPDSGLDLGGRGLLRTMIAAARARGAAVVVSAHDLDFAFAVADRALLLRRGRVALEAATAGDGEPTAVLESFARALREGPVLAALGDGR